MKLVVEFRESQESDWVIRDSERWPSHPYSHELGGRAWVVLEVIQTPGEALW